MKFTLENVIKACYSAEIGNSVKQTKFISFQNEDLVQECSILGSSNPLQLVQTAFYLIGIGCALKTGKEHHALRSIGRNSQFSFQVNTDGVKCIEDLGNKTNKGGLKHKKCSENCFRMPF